MYINAFISLYAFVHVHAMSRLAHHFYAIVSFYALVHLWYSCDVKPRTVQSLEYRA